ncbi:MAG: hypothetical protein Q9182_005723 [Xanthomendoza sp. 2 TL-2023]
MLLNIESPEPQNPLKRVFEECDSSSWPPTKRQQIQSTPLTPDDSLDKAAQPSPLQPVSLAPDAPRPLKRIHEESFPSSLPPSKRTRAEAAPPNFSPPKQQRRIEEWLADTSPPWTTSFTLTRTTSCPPRLEACIPHTNFEQSGKSIKATQVEERRGSEEQLPLLEALQKMSQLQRVVSTTSGRSSRLATSDPGYRGVLLNNGLRLDHTGKAIPPELRSFLDASILRERNEKLDQKEIDAAIEVAVDIADSPENNVYDLIATATFPIKRPDIGRGGNTPWYTDGLPRKTSYLFPLATPKPDIHCGYQVNQKSTWSTQENSVIDHQAASRLTQPTRSNCFPFLIFELKSEATGGTLWQAENQAAGSGSYSVNAVRWIYQEADGPEEPPIVDTIAFSACVTHRQVVIYVHWYSAVENQHYMSWIASLDTMHQVQQCNNIIQNIFDHCLNTRQKKIRAALEKLNPIPERWKQARSASEMNSPVPDGNVQMAPSPKSQRLG